MSELVLDVFKSDQVLLQKKKKTLTNTDKYRYWFTFEQLPLELDPLSQSMKLFNQNVNTGSNLSSSNISDK